MLYDMTMTKQPLPRYRVSVHLTLEVSAASEEQADERLEGIRNGIQERLDKSTFRRLAGRPEVTHIEWADFEPA